MAQKDPAQVAQKWANNLGAATQHITAGVQAVQTAPGQAAAAKKALWLSRLQNSADKWARNVSRVSLEDWKAAMLNKGVQRISSGATAAVPKMTTFMTEFLPYVERGAQQVRAMPKGDLGASIARASAMIQHNAGFRRGGGTA